MIMKKIICLFISCCVVLSFFPAYAANKILFDFESGNLDGFDIKSGQFGNIITDRVSLMHKNGMINKQGTYFLSTLDDENGEANDNFTGIIESNLFNVNTNYFTFLIGGGTNKNIYIALCNEDGDELIKIYNDKSSQDMTRKTVDISELKGKRAFIRIVDLSKDYYGFVLADAFALVDSEEDVSNIGDTGKLFYSNFNDGVMPSQMSNAGSWFVGADPDNNLCLQNKNAGGMSSLIEVGDDAWSNYTVKFMFKALKLGNGAAIHMNFRMQENEKNCYRLVVTANGNVSVRIVNDGAYGDSQIVSGSIADISNENVIEVRVSSALIELYINGIKQGEGSDSKYKSGRVSFGTWAMIGAFDNIEITKAQKVNNVQSISLPYETLQLNVGDTLRVEPHILPEDATIKTVKYISRNLNAATITPEGILRAVGEGEALIVVRTNDGNLEARCNVTVKEKSFSDTEEHWANGYIKKLASQGVINGITNETFQPDSLVTREQCNLLISRMKNADLENYKMRFTTNLGQNATRQEFFALAGEYYKGSTGLTYTVGNVTKFIDAKEISDDSLEYINVLDGLKILSGNQFGELKPNDTITRGEVSKILDSMFEKEVYDDVRKYDGDNFVGFGLRNPANFKVYEPNSDVIYYVRGNGDVANSRVEVSFVNKQTKETKTEKIEISNNKFESEGKFIPDKNGIYQMKFVYVDKTGVASDEDVIEIGVCPKSPGTSDEYLYFGIQPQISFAYSRPHWDHNFHGMSAKETFDLSFDLMEWLGVNLVREGASVVFNKDEALKEPEEWPWQFNDDLYDRTLKNGMTVDMVLNNKGTVVKDEYSGKADAWDSVPKTTQSILDVTKIIMDRYKDQKIIYEFGNESNYPSYFMGSETEYVEQLSDFAAFVKKENPNALVSSAGLVPDGPNDESIFYDGISKLKSQGLIDFFAYHSHGSFDILKGNLETIKGYAENSQLDLSKNVLLNETGMDVADKEEQVNQIMRKLLWAYGHNQRGTVVFLLRQYPELAISGGMGGYALVDNYGNIRETFVGYNNLIKMLSGTQTVSDVSQNNIHAFRFLKNDESVIAVFTDDDVAESTFTVVGEDYKIYDVYGNELESLNGYKASKSPIYIVGANVNIK